MAGWFGRRYGRETSTIQFSNSSKSQERCQELALHAKHSSNTTYVGEGWGTNSGSGQESQAVKRVGHGRGRHSWHHCTTRKKITLLQDGQSVATINSITGQGNNHYLDGHGSDGLTIKVLCTAHIQGVIKEAFKGFQCPILRQIEGKAVTFRTERLNWWWTRREENDNGQNQKVGIGPKLSPKLSHLDLPSI